MAFRSKQLMKTVMRNMGGPDSLPANVQETIKKCLPNSKIVMGRAKRGIFAGKHIQFGNKVSEDGGNKSRRTWKPNVQEKRLFSYILDRHICVKVTMHALRCIDKAGGIDEYLLKTPYRNMDSELGLLWKARIEKMYAELGNMEVAFYSPEEEQKLEEEFKQLKISRKEAEKEARRKTNEASGKQKQIVNNSDDKSALKMQHHQKSS